MTAQVKRFPKKLAQAERTRDPETHALWVKYDRIGNRLEEIARLAALLSFAVTGVMELEQSNDQWPLRDAADKIDVELQAIAEEVRL